MELMEKCKEFLKIRLSLVYFPRKLDLASVAPALQQLKERQHDGFYASTIMTEIQGQVINWTRDPSERLQTAVKALMASIQEKHVDVQEGLFSALSDVAEQNLLDPVVFIKLLQQSLRAFEIKKGSIGDDSEAFYECLQVVTKVDDVNKLLTQYLQRLGEQEDSSDHTIEQDFKLKVINQYLQERLSENVTSVDVAEYLHLNPSYFSRYFKKVTGTTFTDYAHRHKIDNAIKMLERPEATIEGAALALGFSDRNYFSKIFKRYMGMTPGDYVQKRTKTR
jgi:two-component system response regulator YesN